MPESATVDLKSYIRNIPGFPKEGVLFRDVMPLFQDPVALKAAVDGIAEFAAGKNVHVVLGAEARGFILGAAVAYAIGAGFVCARKPGKLPGKTVDVEYELEYGTDRLAIHEDAIRPGMNVLVHDDLLATGGTAAAKCALVEKLGGKVVGVAFLVELSDEFPNARERLSGYDILSLITF
jgi:adenine phosphoribosyltransferase